MANNVITATYSSSNITYTKPAYQYDYGMILQFSGIDLPQAYEVHFSNTEFCGESISQIGDETGVTIPDEMFLSGAPIYAWTYLHTGEDDGETVYKAVISVNKRAKPSDLEPTPVQQDVITQAIAALNTAVEQTAQDVIDATAAKDAAETAQGLAESARDASETAQGKAEDAQEAAENAQEAAETAQGKAEDAQEAAEQAAGAVLGLTADASVDANTGTPSVEVNVSTVSDHKNMSFSFHNLKGVPGDPGEPGDDGFSPVVSVSSITGGHEVAVTDKNGTQTFDVMDGTDGEDGVSPTVTVTEITGGHEVAVTDAEGTQTFDVMDGEVSEEQLETALIDKADIITSSVSGDIVTIADGGKDLPVVDLKVSLLPVQDLHGQDAPYPAGGGPNLRAGIDLANDIKTKVPSATIDTTAKTVSFDYDAEQTSGLYFPIYQYKENTRYTFIITVFNQTIGRTNLRLYYTDSSYTDLPDITANTKQTIAVVSSANKTVLSFSLRKQGGRTVIYYDEWATLEGVHTVSDFAPYENICPISGWTGVKINKDDSIVFPPDTAIGQGTVNGNTGAIAPSNVRIRSTYFPIQPNTKYTAYSNLPYIGARFFSSNEQSGIISDDSIDLTADSITFTTGSTTKYARLIFAKATPSSGSSSVAVAPSDLEYVNVISNRGEIIPIDWTDEAGTVYGCNIDPVSGVLTVTDANIASYDGETLPSTWISDRDVYAPGTTPTTGAQVVYKLATPTTYQLTPVQIQTLLGTNNFWSNGNGSLDLEYRADTKLYIENLTKPSEDDMTANANIASGRFFMVGNRLMLSTTAIAQGEQIVVGTNCSEVSLADALNQINA